MAGDSFPGTWLTFEMEAIRQGPAAYNAQMCLLWVCRSFMRRSAHAHSETWADSHAMLRVCGLILLRMRGPIYTEVSSPSFFAINPVVLSRTSVKNRRTFSWKSWATSMIIRNDTIKTTQTRWHLSRRGAANHNHNFLQGTITPRKWIFCCKNYDTAGWKLKRMLYYHYSSWPCSYMAK